MSDVPATPAEALPAPPGTAAPFDYGQFWSSQTPNDPRQALPAAGTPRDAIESLSLFDRPGEKPSPPETEVGQVASPHHGAIRDMVGSKLGKTPRYAQAAAGMADPRAVNGAIADVAVRRFRDLAPLARGGRFDEVSGQLDRALAGEEIDVPAVAALAELVTDVEEHLGVELEQGDWRVAGLEDTGQGVAVELDVPADVITGQVIMSAPSPSPATLEELQAPARAGGQVLRVGPDGSMAVHGGEHRLAYPSSAKDSEGRPLLRPRSAARIADVRQIRSAHGTVPSSKTHVGAPHQHPAFADEDSMVIYTTDPSPARRLAKTMSAASERPQVEVMRSVEGTDGEGEASGLTPVLMRFSSPELLAEAWEMLEDLPGLAERTAYTDTPIDGAFRLFEHHAADEVARHYTWFSTSDAPHAVPVQTDRPEVAEGSPLSMSQVGGGFDWSGVLPIDDVEGQIELEPGVSPDHPLDPAAVRFREGGSPSEAWFLPSERGLRLTYSAPPVPAPRMYRSSGGLGIELPADDEGRVDPLQYDELQRTVTLADLPVNTWGTT